MESEPTVEDPLGKMACLQTTQDREFPQEKDINEGSRASFCKQTSNSDHAGHTCPTVEECKVEYSMKKSLFQSTDMTVCDINAPHGNHEKDHQEGVSHQVEKQETMQHQCSTEKVLDNEPYRPVIESADVSVSPVKETEYDLKGHAVHCEMEFNVSKRFLTQEDSSACSDPKEDIHVMTTVIQREKGTNGHSEEEIMHTTGPGVQGQITIRGSVTFATPLEEYFEYAVSLDTIDEIPELPALEYGSTDYEISMYDVEENKLTDWKIPSSLDVASAKRKQNEETETCHYPDIIQECIRDDEPLEQNCREHSVHSFPTHKKSIVAGGDFSQQSEAQVEDKESDDQKSLREDAFSLIYREPSELLDTSLDNDMTEAAIKRCIGNDDGLAYGCSQEEQILPNMNYYGVPSSPTGCMEQSGNDKDSLHPEVKQVIACVVQQVMAAISPAEDVVMQQECQEGTDLAHIPIKKDGKETQLKSICSESCNTEEASEKTKEPLKISIDCVTHGVKESERVKMKEEAESLSPEGVVTPVRQSDIEGASVIDRAEGSPLIPSQFSTSNNFPNSVSESPHVAGRNVDNEKIEIQCGDDVSLKLSKPEDNQVSGFSKQADRQVEVEAIAFESSCHVPSVEKNVKNDDENAAQEVKKLDLLLSQEDMFDAETVDDNSGILIQDDMQKYSLKDIVQMKDSDAKVVVSPEKRRKIENSSAEDEGISQAHIPELQDNGPASDTLEHEPHNQSKSEDNGDNLIELLEIDNVQCKNDIIKVPEESKPLDVQVLPKVVRQEYPNEMGAYVSKALPAIAQTDTVNKDMDSSQTLFQSFPSPGSIQPSSLPHRNPLNDGLQSPGTDANVVTCTKITEALHDSESGLKTETQSASETPYSVTDSPYIASSDRGSTTHGQDIVRSCSQDDALYDNTKTPFMEQSLNSSTSGHSTATSQDHVPIQEAQASVAPNTYEHHDVFKEQQGMALLTPTPKGGSETDREISEPMKLEPTDIELLVEEISQKLDLTMEHLSPAPSQKQRDEDSSTPLTDPLKSDFVKVSVVRSESQSSIICLQSLHDHIPDAETDETNTRDELSPQRHSLKRRSVSQDLVIPTKTQRSENRDQRSQPHHMALQEDSADSSVDGEASSGEIQPTTVNDVGISSRSPVKEWAVPESHLMGRKGQLEASPQWREDQAVPDNREGPKATLQCHLVEHDSLSLYDDGTTDLKKVAAYRLSPNHDMDTPLKPETFQQCPPDSATDNISSPSTSSEGSVKSHSPRHNDHQRVPDSPRSSFRWKYAPSVDFDSASVLHENVIDEDAPSEMCRLQPLVTCRRPLRVGLSRRHRGPSLHPNFRPSHRLDDM